MIEKKEVKKLVFEVLFGKKKGNDLKKWKKDFDDDDDEFDDDDFVVIRVFNKKVRVK